MIRFSCNHCGRCFQATDDVAGRKTRCAQCGAALIVPGQKRSSHASQPQLFTTNPFGEFETPSRIPSPKRTEHGRDTSAGSWFDIKYRYHWLMLSLTLCIVLVGIGVSVSLRSKPTGDEKHSHDGSSPDVVKSKEVKQNSRPLPMARQAEAPTQRENVEPVAPVTPAKKREPRFDNNDLQETRDWLGGVCNTFGTDCGNGNALRRKEAKDKFKSTLASVNGQNIRWVITIGTVESDRVEVRSSFRRISSECNYEMFLTLYPRRKDPNAGSGISIPLTEIGRDRFLQLISRQGHATIEGEINNVKYHDSRGYAGSGLNFKDSIEIEIINCKASLLDEKEPTESEK